MTKIAMIRCEKNSERCPLTNCFRCLMGQKESFARYKDCVPMGVFTCRCPGENAVDLGKILKSKGAEAIHFTTCSFAKKTDEGWSLKNGGFCDDLDKIIERVYRETGLPCIKGTAHLPRDYDLKVWV